MPIESNSLRLERCIRILLLLQFTKKFNPTQLADMFNVSRRTIFRDILLLRKSGVPVEFDEDVGTYYIRSDFEGIRKAGLDLKDLLTIATAIESSKASAIPGFRDKIGMAWTKVISTVPLHSSNPQVLNPLSGVNGRDHGLTDDRQIDVWNILFEAITTQDRVNISTQSSPCSQHFLFRPASIGMGNDGWHVKGVINDENDETKINLSTIVSIETE